MTISDPKHPHYGEIGWLTGELIQMKYGTCETLAKVRLEGCRHGTDACFVSKGQVTERRHAWR